MSYLVLCRLKFIKVVLNLCISIKIYLLNLQEYNKPVSNVIIYQFISLSALLLADAQWSSLVVTTP